MSINVIKCVYKGINISYLHSTLFLKLNENVTKMEIIKYFKVHENLCWIFILLTCCPTNLKQDDDLANTDLFLFPVCHNNHWIIISRYIRCLLLISLCIIDKPKESAIEIYNSLLPRNPEIKNRLQ